MATILLGRAVPSEPGSWRGYRQILPLPTSNFRESARALSYDDLAGARRTIENIRELEAIYKKEWPPKATNNFVYKTGNPTDIALFLWWALWRDFPIALFMYEFEILRAIRSWNKLRWYAQRDISDEELFECLLRFSGKKYTPKLERQYKKEIEWLGFHGFHSCHRNYLTHSNRMWYRQYGWRDPSIKMRLDNSTTPDTTITRATLLDCHGQRINTHHHEMPTFAYEFWFPNDVVEFADKVRYAHLDMCATDPGDDA